MGTSRAIIDLLRASEETVSNVMTHVFKDLFELLVNQDIVENL